MSKRKKPVRKTDIPAKGNKKNTPARKLSSALALKGSLSLVIPCYNEAARVAAMASTLISFARSFKGKSLEIIIVDDGSDDGSVAACENALEGKLPAGTQLQIITNDANQGKGGVLKQGVAAATGDHILTLDADMASSPAELRKWLALQPEGTFPHDRILIASREHPDSEREGSGIRRFVGLVFNFIIQLFTNLPLADTQCGFKLYPAAIGKDLFARLGNTGWAHDVELLYRAKLQGIPIQALPVKWEHQEDSKINVAGDSFKMFFQTLAITARLNLEHFITQPLKELKDRTFDKADPSYYRLLFVALSLFLLIAMPMLSFDYGITGDEEVQKIYGEKLLDYYESDGKDDSALSYKNLYYYGGLFDYSAAWINKYVSPLDEWDTRHLLNSLIGFLMMLFTGLAARAMSDKWRVAFFALLFIALSPRIFGHSMNNPKDIPFAAAYAFTLLYLIRFVRQLPFISSKTVAMLIIGIAAAINVRVGGILLIAYFGLFAIAGNLSLPDVKERIKDTGYLIRMAGAGVLVCVLGFLGGMLFWPYGMQEPVANSLAALNEMSNFSTGIRMLFEGEHYWSDKLPWYYIPKWFLISTPLLIMLGWLLFIGFFAWKFKESNWRAILLVGFVAVFPPVYAIYQDSALYDGIRHFLFIYPALTILAAWGWHQLMVLSDKLPVRAGVSALLATLLALPLYWMVRSHPYQYIYFNEIAGGLKGAYTNYETDYWMTSVKKACEWLAENDADIKNGTEKVRIKTNCASPATHYMNRYAKDSSKMDVGYYNFRDRHKYHSHYDIFISRFTNREFLINGVFPPQGTVYTEELDGVPLATVSKRGEPYDYQALKAEEKRDFATAIELYKKELGTDPKNDAAMLGLIRCYFSMGDMAGAKSYIDQLMVLSDTYINGLLMLGTYQQQANQPDAAMDTYRKINKLSYKEQSSYMHLANLSVRKGQKAEALKHLEGYAAIGGGNAQAYAMGEQIAKDMGDQKLQYYFAAKSAFFKGDGNGVQQNLRLCLGIDPDYELALELEEQLNKALKK